MALQQQPPPDTFGMMKRARCGPKPKPPEVRFWSKVDRSGSCWLWLGAKDPRGYGRFGSGPSKTVFAHRFAYSLRHGAIPGDLVLDHLCRNPSCVNPDHLEPVTTRVNILRGVSPAAHHAQATHCINGHPFNEENTVRRKGGGRDCRACKRETKQARRHDPAFLAREAAAARAYRARQKQRGR